MYWWHLFVNSYKTGQPVLKPAVFADPFQSGSDAVRIGIRSIGFDRL